MGAAEIVLLIAAIAVGFGIVSLLILSYILYSVLLVRTSKKKWQRGPSMPEVPEYKKLYDCGADWRLRNASKKEDVSIRNGRFSLYGEYYDYGSDKAVIILPGRMETCYYSAFFAEPYEKAGYNVLTIDPRAHGKSDGRYNSLGYKEWSDVIAWAKMLHEEKRIRMIVLHGVCIGSSAACFTLTNDLCPDYVAGMVGEGMYTCFNATFRTHLEHQGHRYFPIGNLAMMYLRIFGGANVVTDGPFKRLPLLKKPILMLHSREDIYSLPEKAEKMYETIKAPKKLVWFATGGHSMIRIHNEENRIRYDEAVRRFLSILENPGVEDKMKEWQCEE